MSAERLPVSDLPPLAALRAADEELGYDVGLEKCETHDRYLPCRKCLQRDKDDNPNP